MILKKILNGTAIVVVSAILASCGGSSSSSGGSSGVVVPPPPPPPPPPPADTQAPTVSFSPASLTVTSGQTGNSTLTSTDNVAVTTGPTVSCTNNGSFSGGVFTAPTVTEQTTSVCTATAGDAAGNTGTGTLTVTITPPPAASGDINLSGKITFDLVPLNTATNGLNYNAITEEPARGITVEAVNSSNAVIATAVTNEDGDYTMTVAPNTNLRIRAKAEMVQTSGAQWDVRVVDNTSSNALYILSGSLADTGTVDQTRNLNAGSGWGGSSYTSTRAAAPFTILDPIYDTLKKFEAVDADVNFPPAVFNWSTRNRAANGDRANGEIGTSSYIGNGQLFILGDANQDTDEYDRHIIIHEWGHYFEDRVSRADSIGGAHSGGQKLDPRVAMGEGFGNALSGMITDDPFYRDSNGAGQSRGFSINVERNDPAGWFDESTVQSVLYDIYDTPADGTDNLALGLGPIYQALTSNDYRTQSSFTTIYSFLDELREQQTGDAAAIDSLAAARGINGTTAFGVGETNSGDVDNALPVYKVAAIDGAAVQVCSSNSEGIYNKLSNRNYVRFDVTSAGSHTLTMRRTSGATARDPDFNVFKDGSIVSRAQSNPAETEVVSIDLTTGTHVVEAFDFKNTGLVASDVPGSACYDFTVTR